jgi:hypothetical protein
MKKIQSSKSEPKNSRSYVPLSDATFKYNYVKKVVLSDVYVVLCYVLSQYLGYGYYYLQLYRTYCNSRHGTISM